MPPGSLFIAAWREYERDRARYLAVAMVYYALVSLVPLLLLLLSMLGLLLRFSESAAGVEQQVLAGIEAGFGTQVRATVDRALVALQAESIVATIISVVGILLAASVLFRHLRLCFRAIWKHEPPLVSGSFLAAVRASVVERAVAFLIVLSGGAVLLVAVLLLAATQGLGRWFGDLPLIGETSGLLLPAVSAFALAALTFGALLKFLPPVAVAWRDVWPAALLCAAGWMIASELLASYGAYLGDSPSASGAFGALFAIMLWMNVVSQVLFFGAELCKTMAAWRAGAGSA